MDSAPVVAVEGLRKVYHVGLFRRFSVEALKGVSLQVGKGEIFGLLGANGAGKTTLIKVLLGIVRGNGGSATVLGYPAGDRRGRERIGYLPENHRIPRHLTGFTALEYYGQLSNLPLAEIRQRREPLLEQVGLKGKGPLPVKSYSKGMLQRLGLAQAMLHEPDLLILDEPTDGVDPKGRAEIRETLFQLKQRGTTVFLNSHLLQEVELVCDRVAILQQGNILRIGPVKELTQATTIELDVEIVGTAGEIREALAGFDVDSVSHAEDGAVRVKFKPCDQTEVDRLVNTLREKGLSIQSMSRSKRTLEQAYLQVVDEVEFVP
jgi:ABC-2 type transport system ATP-binding protein